MSTAAAAIRRAARESRVETIRENESLRRIRSKEALRAWWRETPMLQALAGHSRRPGEDTALGGSERGESIGGAGRGEAAWSAGWPAGRSGRVLGLLATLAPPAVLYLLTLYPGVGGRVNPGDSFKYQYIGQILGVPHEPGYPQYVVLNFLWTSLPWPFEAALQVNLLSAFCTLVAGGFLWRALARWTGRPVVAALGTWTLLLSHSVWVFSTEAEVLGLQLAWACVVLWIAVRWMETRSRWWLVALLAAVAFSFGNHPLAVVLLIGAVVLVLAFDPSAARSPGILGAGLLVALLAASQYGFLLLRAWSDAPYVEAVPHEAGLADLWRGMIGQRFFAWHWMDDGWQGVRSGGAEVFAAAVEQLSVPVLLAAAFGAVVAARRRQPLAGFLVAVLATSLAICLPYQVPDPQPYQSHMWLPLAALAAFGVAALPRYGRFAACLLWAAILLSHAVRDFRDLRVPASPFDRSTLVAQAPPDSTVLLWQVTNYPYPTEQLANYYSYGFAPKAAGVTARPAEEALAAWEYLGEKPLVFTAGTIRKRLQRRRVLSRPLGGRDGRGRPIFITDVEHMDRLTLMPGAEGLEIRGDHAEELIAPRPGVRVVVLDPRLAGVRAVQKVPWSSTPSTARQIWEILRSVRSGDAMCLVIQGEPDRVRRLLEELAPGHDMGPEPLHSAVLLANLEVSPHWLRVLVNPGRRSFSIQRWAGGHGA